MTATTTSQDLPAKPKRKAVSTRTRFEILKRDKFTCRYCGAKAPDVLLEVDHIKPVADGGTNDPLNLVTACESCNGGKSCIPLSDESAVAAARVEAEERQARAEQLRQIAEWHADLARLDDEQVKVMNAVMAARFGFTLNPGPLRRSMIKAIEKYGMKKFVAVAEKTDQWLAFQRYEVEPETIVAKLLKAVSCPSANETPGAGAAYIAGILRNRFGGCNGDLNHARQLTERLLSSGESFEAYKSRAQKCETFDDYYYGAMGACDGLDYWDEQLAAASAGAVSRWVVSKLTSQATKPPTPCPAVS